MAEKYNSSASLKLPAHVTILPPFSIMEEKEEQLVDFLQNKIEGFQPFNVHLVDFGCFKPRVIYIKVEQNQLLQKLYILLNNEQNLFFETDEKSQSKFHPHITIAFRDLSKEQFKEACNYYSNREFFSNFNVESICFFKHNGKNWDILKTLNFKSKKNIF